MFVFWLDLRVSLCQTSVSDWSVLVCVKPVCGAVVVAGVEKLNSPGAKVVAAAAVGVLKENPTNHMTFTLK